MSNNGSNYREPRSGQSSICKPYFNWAMSGIRADSTQNGIALEPTMSFLCSPRLA